MKTHDIKKIMMGLSIDESQSPGIRFEVVMDGIPEELQCKMESEIKEFEKKAMDIVTAATETMPSKIVIVKTAADIEEIADVVYRRIKEIEKGTLKELEVKFRDGTKKPEERMEFLDLQDKKEKEIANQIAEILMEYEPYSLLEAISILHHSEHLLIYRWEKENS